MTGGDPRTWTLAFGGSGPLNANDRDAHWGRRHRHTAQLRQDAADMAAAVKLPQLERARIVYVVRPATETRMDPANQYPTVKAYVDGLVKAKLLPDDNGWRLIGPDPRQGDPYPPFGRLELRIAELPPLLRFRCVSPAAAIAVAGAAEYMTPGGIDLEHRAKSSGHTVTVMYTDPAFPADLAEWAHTRGHTRKLAYPRP